MRNIQIQTKEVYGGQAGGRQGLEEEGVTGRITLGVKEREVR